jgi:hypothetical protein
LETSFPVPTHKGVQQQGHERELENTNAISKPPSRVWHQRQGSVAALGRHGDALARR